MSENLVDRIIFRAEAPKTPLPGLDDVHAKLKAITSAVQQLQGALGNVTTNSAFKRTRADLTEMFKPVATGTRKLVPVKDAAAAMGIPDVKDFELFVNKWKRAHKELKSFFATERVGGTGGRTVSLSGFASAAKAAHVAQLYLRQASKGSRAGVDMLQALFNGKATGAVSTGAGGVALTVDPNQVQAVLGPGMVRLIVSPAQIQATAPGGRGGGGAGGGGGGGSAPAGGTAGGGASNKQVLAKFRDDLAAINNAMAQAIGARGASGLAGVNDPMKVAALKEKAASQIRALVGNVPSNLTSNVGVQNALAKAAGLSTSAGDMIQKELSRQMDRMGKARESLQKAQLANDKALIAKFEKEYKAEQARKNEIDRMAAAQTKAQQKIADANQKQAARVQSAADAQLRRQVTFQGAQFAMSQFQAGGGKVVRQEGPPGGNANRFVLQRDLPNGMRETMFVRHGDKQSTVKTVTAPTPQGAQSWLARGAQGFTAAGFAKNLLSVTAWSTAVAALYAPLRLVNYSLERMVEIGLQTARLGQVFRGVGGTARELTDDVLALAAANGRSTEEAMQSAVAWSRLGLTRVQVNEAVRVSLMAANVAELSAGEATEHLSATMAAYSLNVGELSAMLSMLNNTSNKFNVTNKDLLEGLSKTASVAKQAGIPLAELQGMIGAGVGRTGQSGANIGNAIKSILVRLGTPEIQDMLEQHYGVISVGKEQGDLKSMSQVLRELYVNYMALNEEDRRFLTQRVAGRTQASRFVAILESYNTAQKLAVDSQLNLNSAEIENAKILATQKAQLAGVRAEWDRLVTRATLGGSTVPAGIVGGASGALIGRLLTGATFGGRFGPIGAAVGAGAGLLSGGSANEQLTDLEHLLRNSLRILNLGPQIQNREPTRLEKIFSAKTRGLNPADDPELKEFFGKSWASRVGLNLAEAFRHPIRSLNAGLDYALENNQEEFAKDTRDKMQKQLGAESAAAGHQREAQRLRTLDEILGKQNTRPEELRKLFGGEETGLSDLVNENRIGEARVRLTKMAAEEEKKSAEAKKESVNLQGQIIQNLQAEIALNEKKQASGSKDEVEQAKDRVTNLRGMLLEAQNVRRDLLTEEEDILGGDPAGRRQLTKTRFETVARQQQELGRISGLQRYSSPVAELQAENRLLEQQISLQKSLESQFQRDQRPVYAQQAAEERQKLQAQLDANRNVEPLVRRRQGIMEFLANEQRTLLPYQVGRDESDALLNERAELERRAARERAQGGTSESLKAAENRLYEIRVRLLDREYEVQRNINQLIIDRRREFERSIFSSGPAEMLRKLAAFHMSQKGGFDSGQFLAMSPEMRREMSAFNPQFDPDMMDLRREQARLKDDARKRWQAAVRDYQANPTDANRNAVKSAFDEFRRDPGAPASATEAGAKAAEHLASNTNALATLTTAVTALSARLAGLPAGPAQAVGAAIGAGGQFGGKGGGVGTTAPPPAQLAYQWKRT